MASNLAFENTESQHYSNEGRYLMDTTGREGKNTMRYYGVEKGPASQEYLRKGSDDNSDRITSTSTPEDREVILVAISKGRNWFSVQLFQFVYLMGVYGLGVTSHTLYLDKSCRLIMNYSQEICDNLTSYQTELDQVQRHGNNYSLYVTLLGLLPAAVTSIFISNWSDKYGRKLPIIFAVFGILVLDVGFLLNGIFLDMPLYSIVLFAIPSGLFGGYLTINTCVFSLISEDSSVRTRTFQHAVMEVIYLTAVPLGTFVGGQLYGYGGSKFVPTFSFVASTHVAAILYALVTFYEPRNVSGAGLSTLIGDLFSFRRLGESFRTCTKPRDNFRRAQIWLLVSSMCVTAFGYMIPVDQILFYFCNKMYGWDTTHYSNVSTYVAVATIVTLTASTAIMTKFFPVRDALLGLLGTFSLIAQNASRSLAKTEWLFFFSVALGVFGGFNDIVIRSMMSKLVSKDEMGNVFMLYSLVVCTTPVFGAVATTQIYNSSVAFFPGLYFAIASVWLLYPLGVFCWINKLEIRRARL